MAEKFTRTVTFEKRGNTYEKYTGFKVGDNWIKCHNGHADKVPVGEPCDIDYAVTDRGGMFLNKVNGIDVSRAPSGGSGGGASADPLAPKPAAPADPLSGGGAGKADQNSWAGMGAENRARMAVKEIIAARYGNANLDIGSADSIGAEMQLVYQGWLQAVEGKGLPAPSGHASAGNGMGDAPDYGDDPGPSGPDDYA